MNKTILVIGGSGLLGRPTVEHLSRNGWKVRAMSRHHAEPAAVTGVEAFRGDAEKAEDLRRALDGCDAVHISVSNPPDWYLETRVVRAVLAQGDSKRLKRVGYVSGASVSDERRDFDMIDAKLEAESLLTQGAVPFTIFRPSMIFDTLPFAIRGGKAMVLGAQPLPAHWLAAEDLGSMVARAFDSPAAVNKTFYLYGREAMTMEQALGRYCSFQQPGTKVKHVPLWLLAVAARLQRNAKLRAVVEMMRYFETHGELGDPAEAWAILGEPQLALEEWCDQCRARAQQAA